MNLQTYHSGQASGQALNQDGTPLSRLPQQNANPVSGHTQHQNMHGIVSMEPERRHMQQKIFEFLMQRRQQSQEVPKQKIFNLVKRLEMALFKSSTTKEEYSNLATLGSRLHFLIKRLNLSNPNQPFRHANSSPAIVTMIPTPGLPQPRNSNMTGISSLHSSLATNRSSNPIASSIATSGSLLPNGNEPSESLHDGAFISSHGALASGHQHPSAFSVNSGGNNMVASNGVPRMTCQMIPTPGRNNYNSVNSNSDNQSSVKLEILNASPFPAVQSTILSQPMQQNQHLGDQNILHNLGGPIGCGVRSTLQQNSHGLPNGPLNGGRGGKEGSNMSVMNGTGTTEAFVTGTIYGNTPKHLEQHQRPVMQGDGTMPKTNSGLMTGKETVHSSQQVTTIKPEPIDQSDGMNYQQYPTRDNFVQRHEPQSFQQPPHQFQTEQLVQPQAQHKQQIQHQLLMKNDSFSQSQLSSNIVSGAKPGLGTEHHIEASLHSQVSNPFQFCDMQSQFQQNSIVDHSRCTQLSTHSSGSPNVCSSPTQTSDQRQQSLHTQQFAANLQNNFGDPSVGNQTDEVFRSQWHAKSQDVAHVSGTQPHVQNLQDEFHNRLAAQDVAQLNNLSSEESIIGQSDASRSTECLSISNSVVGSDDLNREWQYKKQIKWLLFLQHARHCPSREGNCPEAWCITTQKLLKHIECCEEGQCPYLRCRSTKTLIHHYRRCRQASCPICIPVRNFLRAHHLKVLARTNPNSGLLGSVNESSKFQDAVKIAGKSTPMTSPVLAEALEDLQPPFKRIKSEQRTIVSDNESSAAFKGTPSQDVQHVEQHCESHIPMKSELKMEVPASVQLCSDTIKMEKENLDNSYSQKPGGDSFASDNPSGFGVQENVKIEKETGKAKPEYIAVPSESTSKSGKPKIKGVSMTELFTPEQVRQHITGLRQWVGQSKAKAERNQAMGHLMSENSCQLCAVERLSFEPPPLYCTPCGVRVKRNAIYYTIGAGETRHYFCILCYNDARGDTMVVGRTTIPKARMEKRRNDEETEEWWVQCDKCEAWQHQICALFNGRRNDGEAEYTCPNCYLEEVERGEREPLPHSAVLGAKDLPRTILSDHMEQRLFAKLEQERQDRARLQGKSYEEVPGAESLVVRVVSSVDKKLEVKPRFLEIFQEENYPTEFPYKSKVVLLFQNIEGVEVCLFGMYVQEFGSECQQPNNRRVYLSYLDSIKYFRPDVRAVTGEALRTFVYHEILIGYLEYCKQRGFTSCYIWACPPLKGEDYVLYCHPEIQKTPKSDKLREWYLSMLQKAMKENIVVELTNLYDHFLVSTGECKAKVTASQLPYFDGDYWPGAAEDMIFQLQQEEGGRKQPKKGNMKKTFNKRALKPSGQTDLSSNASKDLMLMHKLGEIISPMKEDFIMVHLQYACTHCCILMVSGNRWVCRRCKKFQLCDKCYDTEQKREDRERHPINQKDKHTLYPVEINGVPDDTKDKDENLESEFFDTRQAFLSLCQGNHYQYDTLRRAKHSSMMVLYHLHNPTAPAFVATCNVCHLDIESGKGWRCETCPEYDVCSVCYQKDGGINHPHKLTNNPSNDRDAQNTEARDLRVMQLKAMLELLVHASQCRSTLCKCPNCLKVKALFRHGMACKVRALGGCPICNRMWYLLQLHSRSCKRSECTVPRCRDLREHLGRLQQQSESRRRAAVMEMMRNRATELTGN